MSETDGPEITRHELPSHESDIPTDESDIPTNESDIPSDEADIRSDETDIRSYDTGETRLAPMNGSPSGIRRADENGYEIIDAMAGRASVFGFGFEPITGAIQSAAETYLGDAAAFDNQEDSGDGSLRDELSNLLGDSPSVAPDSIFLCPSADLAVETAIGLARRFRPEKSFRTIALLGSDHGRTGMCRTASGRPELQQGYGPMMAGFSHLPAGDLDAVNAVVDEQTACILLSPIQMQSAACAFDAEYLAGLREICDQRRILLVIDETQLAIGSSGRPFAFSSIADIHADIVILAGGLFAGLAGGIVLASQHVTGGELLDIGRYPLLSAVASTTLSSMTKQGLPESATESMHRFAVAAAEQLSGFEFVRDVNVLGMTIGIETDIESAEIVRSARRRGLRIESAGETAIRIQPPLVMSDADQQLLLTRLGETIEAVERDTADLSI
jgi:acetylornithine/N-succinyldiaminopimelate aminotransferase